MKKILKRKEGFYWVKHRMVWVVAEYDGVDWYICGREEMYDVLQFEDIGSKIEPPANDRVCPIHKTFLTICDEFKECKATNNSDNCQGLIGNRIHQLLMGCHYCPEYDQLKCVN